jgi:uncharacterized protein (UPF0276 family)
LSKDIRRDALGLGLRPCWLAALATRPPGVDFLEVLVENLLGEAELPGVRLEALGGHFPLVGHGVSLDVAGTDPLDRPFLRRLAQLLAQHQMPWHSDHLCWTSSAGHAHHELLPTPHVEALIPYVASRVRAIRSAIGVPFGLENVSSYLRWKLDDLPEWVFLRRVAEEADCGLLLDVNNIVVSAVNHGFDPLDYLDEVPWERVLHVHLAGHQIRPDGLRHDTHDRSVSDEVWAVYAEAWRRGGPFPTVLEWDDQIPDLPVALAELDKAREVRG